MPSKHDLEKILLQVPPVKYRPSIKHLMASSEDCFINLYVPEILVSVPSRCFFLYPQ